MVSSDAETFFFFFLFLGGSLFVVCWIGIQLFISCILIWERRGELGSGGEGERMKIDLERVGLLSKNIQD